MCYGSGHERRIVGKRSSRLLFTNPQWLRAAGTLTVNGLTVQLREHPSNRSAKTLGPGLSAIDGVAFTQAVSSRQQLGHEGSADDVWSAIPSVASWNAARFNSRIERVGPFSESSIFLIDKGAFWGAYSWPNWVVSPD